MIWIRLVVVSSTEYDEIREKASVFRIFYKGKGAAVRAALRVGRR